MMLEQGQIVAIRHGRVTNPVPKIDCGTNRKAANTIARIHRWLVDNAKETALAEGAFFALQQFRNMKKLSPADVDVLNDYLFG